MALLGIDNLSGDALTGFFAGIGLIILNVLGIFSLALPVDPQSFATLNLSLLVIVLIAPIFEEAFFRGLFREFLFSSTKSQFIARYGQAVVFAIFHSAVYTGVAIEVFKLDLFFAVSGAFISAFLFGVFADFMAQRTNNLLTSILIHMIINFWLVLGVLIVI